MVTRNSPPISVAYKSPDSGIIYTLTFIDALEAVICSCPHFRFRLKPGMWCKHIEAWAAENGKPRWRRNA